ncbi:MAG: HlyD family efflux transporter periplasmic adaptor subunit [Magnetococcales bacterium]|nr:HlyD family efflux transporter periplasmic adaptor subunit [Magnetococcales bacterium]MBF0116556.1 HlyD family efflux transporter periplasmic adaptor subunit [Magnetococcales bacterium]
MSPTDFMAHPVQFPTLRKDLIFYPGPRSSRGEPSWTLHDPSRNRFFRIGWLEFEILTRLELRDLEQIVTSINAGTTLTTNREQIAAFIRFLTVNSLVNATGTEGFSRLRAQSASMIRNWSTTLLHSYLFFRIPLIRPDRFLVMTLPAVSWMFSERFVAVICFSAMLGLYLITRQWEAFFSTFSYLFSWQGAALFAGTLSVIKVAHEFGHAYAARHYGCRVPVMGIAFLVMWPVLFTDTSEAWKLASKHQRLVIGAAGMLAELILAILATLAWSLFPDGPLRSIALFVATTNWIMTLTLNLSPFMRFDGYFLFSDWIGIQNLHERSSVLGRWWLRHLLLGTNRPCPESLPRNKRRFLIAFAYATWLYRLILFLGIALLVYHFFFKLAGVFLMAVEIGWFIALPIANELKYWIKDREHIYINTRTSITFITASTLIVFAVIPWASQITAPAVMKKDYYTRIFSTLPGRIESLTVEEGKTVQKGDPLLHISSKDIEYRLIKSRLDIMLAQWQLTFQGMDPKMMDQNPVIQRELETSLTEYNGILAEQKKMSFVAPFSGEVVAISEHLKKGDWIRKDELLFELVDHKKWLLEAFIDESDLERISVGAEGIFYPEILDWPPIKAHVTRIDDVGTKDLSDPYLVSPFGGHIPVKKNIQTHKDDRKEWIPETSIYRVILEPSEFPEDLHSLLRGTVTMKGVPRSMFSKMWKAAVAILIRESGF